MNLHASKSDLSRPVFDLQAGDAAEIARIESGETGARDDRLGGDHSVDNLRSAEPKRVYDPAVRIGLAPAEWQDLDGIIDLIDLRAAQSGAFLGEPDTTFEFHHGQNRNEGAMLQFSAAADDGHVPFAHGDENAGIEQARQSKAAALWE